MSNKKITKLLSILAVLGASSNGLQNPASAFNSAGAAINPHSRQTSTVSVAEDGAKDAGLGTGSAVKEKTWGITDDGRVIVLDGVTARVPMIKANGAANADIDNDGGYIKGDEADDTKKSIISQAVMDEIKKSPKFRSADAIDLIGKEVFVDAELYLRTKDGNYLTSITKKDGKWTKEPTSTLGNNCIKIDNGVIRSMPDSNPFKIECTYEYQALKQTTLYYSHEDSGDFLRNESGEYCDWKGVKVDESKKVKVGPFKNFLEIDDIPNELSFRFDQGQKATKDGWRKVTNKELSLVAVEVKIEVDKDGKKQKEKHTFLYSPKEKQYLGADGKLKEKPELGDEVNAKNLKSWGISVAPDKVQKMKNVAWQYNIHDKTWKMVATYGGMALVGASGLGGGAYVLNRLLSKNKAVTNAKPANRNSQDGSQPAGKASGKAF